MPQLPSGRHIGIGADPLLDLVEDFDSGKIISCWRFLAIEELKDLYPYIEIFYLEDKEEGKKPRLMENSLPPHAELKQFETGLRVTDVFKSNSDWSEEDKIAFQEFLESERFVKGFKAKLEGIQRVKKYIEKNGTELQKAEIALWKDKVRITQEELDDY